MEGELPAIRLADDVALGAGQIGGLSPSEGVNPPESLGAEEAGEGGAAKTVAAGEDEGPSLSGQFPDADQVAHRQGHRSGGRRGRVQRLAGF